MRPLRLDGPFGESRRKMATAVTTAPFPSRRSGSNILMSARCCLSSHFSFIGRFLLQAQVAARSWMRSDQAAPDLGSSFEMSLSGLAAGAVWATSVHAPLLRRTILSHFYDLLNEQSVDLGSRSCQLLPRQGPRWSVEHRCHALSDYEIGVEHRSHGFDRSALVESHENYITLGLRESASESPLRLVRICCKADRVRGQPSGMRL